MGAQVGPVLVTAAPLTNLLLWTIAAPADPGDRPDFARQMFGEAVGSTVVVLLAITLLLATRARFLEPPFGGLDKMYRAHRQAGQAATVLLILHVAVIPWRLPPGGGVPSGLIAFAGFLVLVALSVGPRLPVLGRFVGISYRSWRRTHRLIGVFFLIALAHVLLVDTLVRTVPVLYATLLGAFAVGIASFLYALLLARFVRPSYRYLVVAVRRLSAHVVEVTLRPRTRRRLPFRSGQFVFVRFRRRGLRQPHPFTVSSAPTEPTVRLTIKSAGHFTRLLYQQLDVGRKATVEGGYGMLDYRRGRPRQVWIAGGIGITPFLSWLRDLPADPGQAVDLFYTVRQEADALCWDEIQAAADRHPRIRVHLHVSSRAGSLTVPHIATAVAGPLPERDFYLCGPVPMIRALHRELRRIRVPAGSIHFEEFSFR